MNRRHAGIGIAVAAGMAGVALLSGPVRQAAGAGARQSLLIASGAPLLELCRAWAQAFMTAHPAVDIVIEEGGDLPALLAARGGAIDLAAMTRALAETEDDALARHFLVAKGELDVIVHAASPVQGLTRGQAAALLTGAMEDWRAAGGDGPVRVYAQRRGAIDCQLVEEVLLDGGDFAAGARECEGAAGIVAAVASDRGGIGAIATRDLRAAAGVRRLAIDGVPARRSTILSGSYPCAPGLYLLLYGAPGGLRGDFLAFARGPAGQRIVVAQGLLPVR